MNLNSKKSVTDFKGQAMSTDQQKALKGGNGINTQATDFIIMDDILDC
ncbi:MAG: hypothetical protein ACI9XO_005033 [Paraglaciecola sp.]|jgi:hypothetical protein